MLLPAGPRPRAARTGLRLDAGVLGGHVELGTGDDGLILKQTHHIFSRALISPIDNGDPGRYALPLVLCLKTLTFFLTVNKAK